MCIRDRNVVTTAGTTSERLLRKMNEEKQMKMNVISAKDHGESFLTLETGRAVAFMMDDALLYGEMAKAKKASDWVVVGTPQSFEAYGCMLRKDDPAFKKIVDGALAKVMTSGEAEKIYAKWFLQPIPPKGLKDVYKRQAEPPVIRWRDRYSWQVSYVNDRAHFSYPCSIERVGAEFQRNLI